jgi:flagellar hook-length control protein FliK
MKRQPISAGASLFRVVLALVLVFGVALSLGLSAAPQLHDWLHKSDASANHECAATLVASGSFSHSASEPVLTPPVRSAATSCFIRPAFRVIAQTVSSILEHAPPALS